MVCRNPFSLAKRINIDDYPPIHLLVTTFSLWFWLSLFIALPNDIKPTAISLDELPSPLTSLQPVGSTLISAAQAVTLLRQRDQNTRNSYSLRYSILLILF